MTSVGTALRAASVASAPSRPMSEGGRVDAARDVAQLRNRLLGTAVGLVDERADLVEVDATGFRQLLLGHAQAHGEGDQLGLCAVVQVTFDPPQRGRRGVDRVGARLLERAHTGRHRVGTEQRPDEEAIDVGEAPHDPGSGQQEQEAHDEDRHAVEEVDGPAEPPRREQPRLDTPHGGAPAATP